jgi:hypothetical protein
MTLRASAVRRSAVRTIALLATLAAPAGAQQSSFSGVWVRADSSDRPSVAAAGDASFRLGDMGSGWGTGTSPLTITQRADSLIVEYVFFAAYDLQPPVRLAYALDGSESVNSVMLSHATSVQRSRLRRAGDSLVIATRVPLPPGVGRAGEMGEVRHTLVLESPGRLVLETNRSDNTVRSAWIKR